jgi:hypothetical protein
MDSNHYSCVGKIRPDVLRESLRRSGEWDALSFDREDGYYDFWALSYLPYIYSFFHFENSENAVSKMREDFYGRMKLQRTGHINDLIYVYSAFNGFSIYKTEIFLECNYSSNINPAVFPSGLVENHSQIIRQNIKDYYRNDCEHRHFHLDAIRRKKARVCISLMYLFEGTKKKYKSFGMNYT